MMLYCLVVISAELCGCHNSITAETQGQEFHCDINGIHWAPSVPPFSGLQPIMMQSPWPTDSFQRFWIVASYVGDKFTEDLRLDVFNTHHKKLIPLGGSPTSKLGGIYDATGSFSHDGSPSGQMTVYDTDSTHVGEITIISSDSGSVPLTVGSFWFDGIGSDGSIIHVRNGYFKLNFFIRLQ